MATCARVFVALALLITLTQAVPFSNGQDRFRRMQPEVVQVVPLESDDETRSVESAEDDSVPSDESGPLFAQQPIIPLFPFGRPWPVRPLFNFNIDPTPLFRPFSDILRRLELEMDAIWRNVRVRNNTNPLGVGEEIDIGKLPANYSNSTSTTKVVNGQVMTVNETIHKSSLPGGESFFRVQVINMQPKVTVEVPVEGEEASSSQSQSESMPESSGSVPQVKERASPSSSGEEAPPSAIRLPPVEYPPASENEVETDDAEEIKVERPIDLSSDIRVNQLLADEAKAGKLFMVDPDAELVDVEGAEDGAGGRVRPRPRPYFHQMALPPSRMEFDNSDDTDP